MGMLMGYSLFVYDIFCETMGIEGFNREQLRVLPIVTTFMWMAGQTARPRR